MCRAGKTLLLLFKAMSLQSCMLYMTLDTDVAVLSQASDSGIISAKHTRFQHNADFWGSV